MNPDEVIFKTTTTYDHQLQNDLVANKRLKPDNLSITPTQSNNDRLPPMVSTDSDSSGYPRSDNYSVQLTTNDSDETVKKRVNDHHRISGSSSTINQCEDIISMNTKKTSINLSSNISPIEIEQDSRRLVAESGKSCKYQTRFIIALLGLTIAVVNCYAQATFCISIVEMVLPSDYVFKPGESDESVVKVVISGSEIVSNQQKQENEINNLLNHQETSDYSCPVEYRYRDYYDSWRFPTIDSNNKNLTQQQQQQPVSRASTGNNFIDTSNRFDWDASQQGLLLGAFAVGTAPLQILGGRLAEIYGAKWVLLAGCIGTALTNLTIPFLAHFSFTMLILNRITMGIAQAGMEPGLMCLLAEWLTPAETGFFISMLLFAICIGFFLGSLCSSFLLTLGYGWPITYYVAGGLNLIVAIVWLIYANSRPRDSKLISADELKFIESEQQFVKSAAAGERQEGKINDLITATATQNQPTTTTTTKDHSNPVNEQNISSMTAVTTTEPHSYNTTNYTNKEIIIDTNHINQIIINNNTKDKNNTKGQAPWINILKTPSVWAFILCKISIRWCADVLAIELPTYLANVLHLSIKLNGILNSVSSALFAICSFITGYFVNEILKDNNQYDKSRQQSMDSLGGVNSNNENNQLTNESASAAAAATIVVGRKKMTKTNLRKLMQSIASFGSAICVFLMTQYDCNIIFSMSMLLILSCCLVMGTGGELQIPYDMTSRYPGTLHGMACTLSVSGWLAPPLIGLILGDQPSSRYRWSLVWYLTALINLIGGLVFVLFADASPRDFDHQEDDKEEKERRNKFKEGEVKREKSESSKSKSNRFSNNKRKINKSEKNNNNLEDFKHIKEEDKIISEEQEAGSDRGRHMMSYYNIACKSSDNSPPQRRPNQQQQLQQQQQLKQQHQPSQQQELCWSSYFDRDLIKIRQTEDSFIKPGYLNNFDSISQTQTTMIFPYNIKPKKDDDDDERSITELSLYRDKNRSKSEIANEYATNLVKQKIDKQQQQILRRGSTISRLWSRVPNLTRTRRRKFSFDDQSKRMVGIRGKKIESNFESSINSVVLPDVLPHSRKLGLSRESTEKEAAPVAAAMEVEVEPTVPSIEAEAASRITKQENNHERDNNNKPNERTLNLESSGNQQFASASPTSTVVSTMMAPLASKTITHL